VLRLCFLMMVTGPLFVSTTIDVHAGYLDPVVGSYLLQGLISGVVAAVVTLRSARDRIIKIFRPKKRPKN
jgi:hypothetical protein